VAAALRKSQTELMKIVAALAVVMGTKQIAAVLQVNVLANIFVLQKNERARFAQMIKSFDSHP
jgi:hypothetical protein